ncbi:uncharacterized protein A4U43_C10F18030 [Asparagus officinalis]|uniref:WAT1-related protein n=1 Tax=Asparagus officinalis TaxID=4686 RepID=A0A5P1E444_ASPOF|nr:uncharacterized protein A4U43_C10F18030 [Asparagus officinalis]
MGDLWQSLKPAMGMVSVQLGFAGVNIFYKLAINDGMDMRIAVRVRRGEYFLQACYQRRNGYEDPCCLPIPVRYKLAINDGMDMRILVAYRYLFASAFLGPLAFFLERKSRPSLTWKILMQAFFCGLFGGTLAQNLYVVSVKLTSATFATAMTNLIPAITFVMAVIFSLEKLGIKSVSGQAKVLGTIVGIGGAMTLTFYKGADINLFSSKFNLIKSSQDIGGIHQQSG